MKKIIIIVSIITVIIVGGLIAVYFYWAEGNLNTNEINLNTADENTNTSSGENINTNTSEGIETNQNINTNTSVQDDKNKIRELARTFAERYGSYSNKNDFEHLANLLSWMTVTFKSTTENYIKTEKAKLTGEEDYFAVTSKVISIQVEVVNESGTLATVSLERTEKNEISNTDTYFQDLVLQFKKVNGLWKINSASWRERISL